MRPILLLGSSGQLGQELLARLSAETSSAIPNLEKPPLVALSRQEVDLTNLEHLHQVIDQHQPGVIVNAAAYTAVDKAETEVELAHFINGKVPTALAAMAKELNALLIHVSTDYVFDGQKNTPYTEEDTPNPIGVYGQSKFAGEMGIRDTWDQHIILRTAWFYSALGKANFVKTMLRLGRDRETLGVVCDQIGSPTWAFSLADAIAQCIEQITLHPASLGSLVGTYHFTNNGVASWYDFAVAIFEEARTLGFPITLSQVLPITTADYPTPAQRPAYSVLSNQKIRETLNLPPCHWRDGLRKMLAHLASLES